MPDMQDMQNMNNTNEKRNKDLSRRIMRRIYVVWAFRTLLNPLFLKSLIVFVFIARSTEYISYSNVFANAPALTDIPRNVVFAREALMHTEATSLGLLLGILAVTAWLATDFLSKTRHAHF